MTFPKGPVWILGLPFTFEFTDTPDDDGEFVWRAYGDRGVFKVLTGMAEEYTRAATLACILHHIWDLINDDSTAAHMPSFTRGLWGSFRCSPDALAYVAGWREDSPSVVSACGMQFGVNYVKRISGASKDVHGEVRYPDLSIEVRSGMEEYQTRYTVLHEWCHAVAHVAAPALADNELFIRAVSYTLMDVFRSNPEYMRLLFA